MVPVRRGLALSSGAQELLAEKFQTIVNDTRADHNLRTVAYAFAGRVMVNEEAEIVAVLCENSAPGTIGNWTNLARLSACSPFNDSK
jgi:hypothetical protein